MGSIYSFVSEFLKSMDEKFKIMLVAIGIYSWATGLPSQYNQLYITALGANAVELGFMNSLGGIASSAISAPAGWFIDKYGVKRIIVFGLVLTAAFSGIYAYSTNWLMLIPAIILASISMNMIMPLTDIIFVGATKPEERAFAMGFSRTIWAIPTVLAPITAAVIVTIFGGINVEGIRPIYLVQLVLVALITLFVALKLKSQKTMPLVKESTSYSKATLIESFRGLVEGERWLKHWSIILSLRTIGMNICMAFIPLWMVEVKGADPYILGTMGTASIVVSALLQVPIGRLADRIGRKKAFLLTCPFAYLGTILLILAPNPESIIVAGILGFTGSMGGIGSVGFVPYITMFWETVPAEKRGRWFGFTSLFNIFAVPASILGGFMWQAGLMEPVLLTPVLTEALIVIPILMKVPDTLGKTN